MFTRFVEGWIKAEEVNYIKEVDQALSKARSISINYAYPEYGRQITKKMDAIRREYCHGYLGFSMICLLHKKYAKKTEDPLVCDIKGRELHVENTAQPSAVHRKYPKDLDKYVELFMEVAKESGKIIIGKDISEALLRLRFTKILFENRYVGVKGGITAISRESIIDICIYLGWSSDDANYLLLRMDDSCLSANSASDLILRFVLDVPEATMADGKVIRKKYRTALKTTKPMSFEDKALKGTRDRVDLFGKILERKVPLKIKRADYAKALMFYAPVFELPSITARNHLERILRIAYVRMGNTDTAILAIPSNIKLVVFDDNISALTPQQQEHLVESILSETIGANITVQNTDTIRYDIAYDALAYPVLSEKGSFAQQLMGVRLKQMLNGTIAVTKRDILYAFFLAESIEWRDKKLKDADMANERYRQFKALANNILEESFLPPFYPVQALEFLIGKAIYMGQTGAEEIFAQITGSFDSLEDPEMERITQIPKEEKDIKLNDKFAYQTVFNNLVELLYYRTFQMAPIPVQSQTEATEEKCFEATLYEISRLAEKLFDIWSSNNFDAMDINFAMSGKIGVKAVGLSKKARYIIVWEMSDELKRLLHEVTAGKGILEEIIIPDLEGTRRSLAEYAERYPARKDDQEDIEESDVANDETLLSVIEKDVDWHRRLRRKCILSIVAGLLLNLYGRKALIDKYYLKKAEKLEVDPEKAIMQIVSQRDEEEKDAFKFFDIFVKRNITLKLYSASKDDYEEYLEMKKMKK